MKTKIFISTTLIISVIVVLWTKPSAEVNTFLDPPPPSNNLDDRFLFGAALDVIDENWNYDHYDSLGFNLWHIYVSTVVDPVTGRHYPFGGLATNDSLITPVQNYASSVITRVNLVTSHNQSRLLLHRPKIEWLCYGQRSDYQCERSQYVDTALWFYSFQSPNHVGTDITDNSSYGSGQYVRYCQRNINQTDGGAGWVVTKLKANTDQSRVIDYGSNHWQGDSECEWFIKPKIRIDSTFAANPVNVNKEVCRIDIFNQGDTLFKSVILRVRNFLVDPLQTYNGRYIEEYTFILGDSDLTHQGAWGNWNSWSARGNRDDAIQVHNKADIKIYWYGNCDMWVDYVRVDNDVAHRLLKGNDQEFERWLQDEVQLIANALAPATLNYYIEYMEFNNLPCLAYVNKKVKQYSNTPNKAEVMADWYWFYGNQVPWENRSTVINPAHVKRFYIDSVGVSQFFAENYPYRSEGGDPAPPTSFSKIPNTLPKTNCIPQGSQPCGMLGTPISPNDYDMWLQDNMDHEPPYYSSNVPMNETERRWSRGDFRYVMKLGNEISKMADIPFIHMPAAHLWYIPPTEVQKEPTNEELDLQANLSVSYGARGLLYFYYWSGGQPGQSGYNRGIAEDDWTTGRLRQKNVYEQTKTKKQTFIDIGKRIKKWEKYLLSFDYDYTNSYTYYMSGERSDLLSNSYFADVVSYKPGSGQPSCEQQTDDPGDSPTGLIWECNEKRYLQVATFRKSEDDGNKYFMLVNRRCSPYVNESSEDNRGGKRFVRIKFDENHPEFAGFNNWKIIDLEDNSTVVTFDKRVGSLLDLNWYLPG